MSEWQPIETAPRDGTQFLVNCPHVECGVSIMQWDDRLYMLVSAFDGKPWLSRLSKPTHWTPLPAPPVEDRP